jgi:aminoglycoside/choline kinase family phosphotransferase
VARSTELAAHDDDARQRIRALVRSALRREVAGIEPVEAGLGSRRFFRVSLRPPGEPESVVARVEHDEDPGVRPSGVAPEPPLEPIRAWLSSHGLPVPACYGAEAGLMLLEDLGDASLESAAHSLPIEDVHALYLRACDLVPQLQAVPPPESGVSNFDRRLDEALFRYKADQFVEWVLPLAQTHAGADVVYDAFDRIAEETRDAPQRLAHRDYKAANLHVQGDRLVMIDLQGAFLAPPEYDLVCLLRDSHVALDEDFVKDALDRVRPRLPDAPAADAFERRFTLLTLSRNSKDLSRYLYAAKVRDDPRYLPLVPRAVQTLRAAAADAAPWDRAFARLADVIASLPDSPCEP